MTKPGERKKGGRKKEGGEDRGDIESVFLRPPAESSIHTRAALWRYVKTSWS